MKRFIVSAILITWLVVPPAHALTKQQWEEANEVLDQMQSKISEMRGYTHMGEHRKAGGMDLVPSQLQSLENKYKIKKAELVDLCNQLK